MLDPEVGHRHPVVVAVITELLSSRPFDGHEYVKVFSTVEPHPLPCNLTESYFS